MCLQVGDHLAEGRAAGLLGGFNVVYEDIDETGTSLRAQRFDGNGNRVTTPPTTIDNATSVASFQEASIAIRSDGAGMVTYSQRTEDGRDLIHIRELTPHGVLGDPRVIDRIYIEREMVPINEDNYAILSVHHMEGMKLAVVRNSPEDGLMEVRIGDTGSDLQIDGQLAAVKGGGVVVAWRRWDGDYDIWAQVIGSDLVAKSDPFEVNILNAEGNQDLPDVAALDDGGFVVIWRDVTSDTVRGQRFDATGNFIGTEFMAVAGAGAQQPMISTLGDGRFMVGFNQPFGDHDVYGTIFDPRNSSYNGTAGNDVITARIDGATITALGGNDQLLGQAGADRFIGSVGNDVLSGAGGLDTAVYAGVRGNYQVHTFKAPGGVVTRVKDGVGAEGNDFLTGIETLVFAGANVTRFGAQSNLVANVDGARFDDVVFRSTLNGQVIFQNMTNGTATGFGAITAPLTSAWKTLGTGDVNTDAKADVLVWNSSSGQVLVASPGGSGTPVWSVLANGINGAYAALDVTDVNGDGYTDVLVRHNSSGTIYWQNGATPAQWGVVGVNLGSAWTYQAAGDVNRDGFADVAIRNASGQVIIANMKNGVNSGYIDLGNISGFAVRAIGDVNADGFADVIVQSETNGQILWRNLSGSGAQWNVASDPLGTSLRVRATADVDNDGSADIIVQHVTTGETLYRAMDAGVTTGWGTVSTPLGTEWVVV